MSIIEVIKTKLFKLDPLELEIIDQSIQHQEHLDWPSEVTHITIKITSKHFNDLSLILRHKKVYDLLREEIPQIHAVSLIAKGTI
jgi:stress-induced morphogen